MIADFSPSHRGGLGTPLVCLHGFTDTWRTWELVLAELEARHDVLAPTLPGHAGGPVLEGEPHERTLADAVEAAMDEAGMDTAHIVGNSLGGYVAFQLAERGRARSVVALAPGGGWADGDDSFRDVLAYFISTQELLRVAAPHADQIAATRRGATPGDADGHRALRAPAAGTGRASDSRRGQLSGGAAAGRLRVA